MSAAPQLSSDSHRRCRGCGAPVAFSPKAGQLLCAYCGTTRAVQPPAPVPVHPLAEAASFAGRSSAEGQIFACSHCGATSDVSGTTAATRCAFCDSPLVPLAKIEQLPPAEGVVPFKVEKAEAADLFQQWVKGLWFRPNDLQRLARLKEMRGVYVPGWIYQADAYSTWTAEAGYYYYEEEEVEVNGKTEMRPVQKTRWESAGGNHAGSYTDLLVCASKGLTAEELEALAPFDFESALTSFDADLLAGFEAETHALSADSCWPVAAKRIEKAEYRACDSEVPGDTHRFLQVDTSTSSEAFQSALVPVYVAAYDYAGTIYRVLVNGRTGQVEGKAPWSWVKITLFVLSILALVAGVYFATR